MEIRHKFEALVATHRRYVIRQLPTAERIACPICGEPMLTTEQASGVFGIKQRRIFQIIEAEPAHFTETNERSVMICMTSMAEVLDGERS